jgi:glycosyltransferase involved in cell wall biosynthesis
MLDAMASRVPVIASAIRAHTDLITHGNDGLICATQEHFVTALRTLTDDEQAQRISTNASRTVSSTYGTWRDCAARYNSLYQRLVRAA